MRIPRMMSLRMALPRSTGKGVTRILKSALAGAFLLATLAAAFAEQPLPEKISGMPPVAVSGISTESSPAVVTQKPKVLHRTVITPPSSQINATDLGKKMHTNFRYIAPGSAPLEVPGTSELTYETPASLACVYGLLPTTATPAVGCNPTIAVTNPTGGSQTIAIVDAYDDPAAPSDLAYFSAQFGIPFNPAKFQVVYASGVEPMIDPTGGWEVEESLDIEYAHAMAPSAMLYLVEADSNSDTDLFFAVQVATNLVVCGKTTTCPAGSKGKGEVSMSWGGSEFGPPLGVSATTYCADPTQGGCETTYDSSFTTPNVVYIASAGDEPGVEYPSASPLVVSAGGTSISRSLTTGNFISEIAWSDAGGGVSQFELIPKYQAGIATAANGASTTYRNTPDLSFDANPNTGVWVYDSFPINGYEYYDWLVVGGTSVAAPSLAGVINAAGHFAASSTAELTTVYADRAVTTDIRDIAYGYCNYYMGSISGTGYDLCTGVGVPKGYVGK